MRNIIILGALVAATVAVPAFAQSPKIFDFMGSDTETKVTTPTINGKPCVSKKDGENSCTLFGFKLGDASTDIVMVNFYDGKISSVLGIAKRREFLSLLSVFTAKYGSPKIETRVWQNRAGAKLDNQVVTWSFKGGKLELAQMGSKSTQTDFQFFSTENTKPAKEPEVNF